MKISTKGRYGLRIMDLLAAQSLESGQVVSITEISDKIGVSKSYLEKLIAILKKHKLVHSSRGQSGGYTLSRSAKDISVGQILRALENDLIITNCSINNCNKQCPGKDVFHELYLLINNHLDTIKLSDINKEILNAENNIHGQCSDN